MTAPAAVALFHLRADQCRWPHGDINDAAFRWCSAPALPGKSYCERHQRRAYRPAMAPARWRVSPPSWMSLARPPGTHLTASSVPCATPLARRRRLAPAAFLAALAAIPDFNPRRTRDHEQHQDHVLNVRGDDWRAHQPEPHRPRGGALFDTRRCRFEFLRSLPDDAFRGTAGRRYQNRIPRVLAMPLKTLSPRLKKHLKQLFRAHLDIKNESK